MAAEWLTSAILIAVLTTGFGHFESVRSWWARITRWLAYLAVTGMLARWTGRPWTFLWIFGLPAIGAIFHIIWCRRHGTNPSPPNPATATNNSAANHQPRSITAPRGFQRYISKLCTPECPAGSRQSSRLCSSVWPQTSSSISSRACESQRIHHHRSPPWTATTNAVCLPPCPAASSHATWPCGGPTRSSNARRTESSESRRVVAIAHRGRSRVADESLSITTMMVKLATGPANRRRSRGRQWAAVAEPEMTGRGGNRTSHQETLRRPECIDREHSPGCLTLVLAPLEFLPLPVLGHGGSDPAVPGRQAAASRAAAEDHRHGGARNAQPSAAGPLRGAFMMTATTATADERPGGVAPATGQRRSG